MIDAPRISGLRLFAFLTLIVSGDWGTRSWGQAPAVRIAFHAYTTPLPMIYAGDLLDSFPQVIAKLPSRG